MITETKPTCCEQTMEAALLGHVHSFDTGAATDGPGLRLTLFLQGCLLRCRYCHNPDTWTMNTGEVISADKVTELLEANLPYYKGTNGGLTVSGGEPLMQPRFVAEVFRRAHALGLNTVLDTNGYPAWTPEVEAAVDGADLILLDIKAAQPEAHWALTHGDPLRVQAFLKKAAQRGKRFWIRHVLIPGWTTNTEAVEKLARLLKPYQDVVDKVELLPFHRMGMHKWEALGLDSPLQETPALTQEELEKWQGTFQRLYEKTP
jgi:pyruvate formate lyase activating enzyme